MEMILLFAPLVGSIICGFGHRIIGEKMAMFVSTGALFLSAILSWIQLNFGWMLYQRIMKCLSTIALDP